MKRIGLAVVLVALFCTVSLRLAAQALPDRSGQNINIVTGSADQFIGDMFRQRQNEPVFGVSSVNPSHMMAAYNDYRTVDVPDDQSVGTPSPVQTLLARVVDFFTAPWRRGGERRRDADELEAAAQAWIGLSFSDNGGKSWYTGLHPGFFANQSADDVSSPLYGYQAASDPVLASTDHQFFVGGIAFTPNATSVGFVSRFTDFNDTATGQNIRFDRTTALILAADRLLRRQAERRGRPERTRVCGVRHFRQLGSEEAEQHRPLLPLEQLRWHLVGRRGHQ